VNDHPFFLEAMMVSIRSARKLNRDIPIAAFIYSAGKDSLPKHVIPFLRRHNVRYILSPAMDDSWKTFLKWFALEHLAEYKRVLIVDADTVFFEDPHLLFKKYKKKDFWVRIEEFTDPKKTYRRFGNIDWPKQRALAHSLNARELPIFGSGVMLFNKGFHRRVAEILPEFTRLHTLFLEKKLALPSSNFFIREEIVASLAMGQIGHFDYGIFNSEDYVWYNDWLKWKSSGLGIIMHVAAKLYLEFLHYHFHVPKPQKTRLWQNAPRKTRIPQGPPTLGKRR